MELYLDTNIIDQYFERIMKREPSPKVFKYLYNVRKSHRYFVSNLVRVEVFRKLHSEHKAELKECYRLWKDFIDSLNIEEIIVEKVDFKEMAKMVAQRPSKRGMIVNILHLMIAKDNNLTVLTGDLKLKERFKVFYKKIITYDELRGFSGSSS